MRWLKWATFATAIAGLAAAGPASAATTTTTVGQLFEPNYACGSSATYLQTSAAAGNSYVVPRDGVITSWSFHSGATPVNVLKLKVGHMEGADYVIDAEDAAGTQAPNAVNTFPANIPVVAGQLIGIHHAGGDCADQTFESLDEAVFTGTDVAPGGTLPGSSTFTNFRFPVSAVVTSQVPDPPQPDTDAPETTITKDPPNRLHRDKAKFKFASDESGSTFECKVDRKPFRSCASPKTVKRLDGGKHKFKVRAIDAAGNVDPTPDKDRFRVLN